MVVSRLKPIGLCSRRFSITVLPTYLLKGKEWKGTQRRKEWRPVDTETFIRVILTVLNETMFCTKESMRLEAVRETGPRSTPHKQKSWNWGPVHVNPNSIILFQLCHAVEYHIRHPFRCLSLSWLQEPACETVTHWSAGLKFKHPKGTCSALRKSSLIPVCTYIKASNSE